MLKNLFPKKERYLGLALRKRRYDLPLDRNAGNKFISMLIALMTILLMLSLTGAFALSEVAGRWSSGLEGKASIEVPAKDINGVLIDADTVQKQTAEIAIFLENDKSIDKITVLREEEILKLVEPWLGTLGGNINQQDTPLPGIISLSFHKGQEINNDGLSKAIQKIAPQARLDTHQSWLNDILKLTGSLRFAAHMVVLVIGLTTIVAIAGAVRTRLSAYKEELELLHLMGAGDTYIANQLQRHTLILALQGSVAGVMIGGLILLALNLFLSSHELVLLPDFTLSTGQKITLFLLPAFISGLALLTARLTVLRTLVQMP